MGIGMGGGDYYDGDITMSQLDDYRSKVILLKHNDLNKDSEGVFRVVFQSGKGQVKEFLYPVLCDKVMIYVGFSTFENKALLYIHPQD